MANTRAADRSPKPAPRTILRTAMHPFPQIGTIVPKLSDSYWNESPQTSCKATIPASKRVLR